MLWLLCLIAGALPLAAQVKSSGTPRVDFISIDGGINPAVDDFIRESIARARESGAKALIIQLDTPGGLLTSTRSIVKEILGAPVPVIVYVAPSGAGAGSAGVFITLSAHIAAMAPGTNIGAAHPVTGGGGEVKGVMGEKLENFTASFGETIAQKRGRNTEWAIQAVRKSVSITEKEALKKNVVDIVAANLDDLLNQADGRKVDIDGRDVVLSVKNARVERFEMGLKQRVINTLADPQIAYLLLMAGILGLYMEFSHPGVIFPGVAGAIALLLAFASFQILPINYAGLALIALGIALLVAEAFLPSFGVVGVGGAISLAIGSLLLFDTQNSDLVVGRSIIFAAVGTLTAYMFFIGYLVLRTQKRRQTMGVEGMVGEIGEARTALNPTGRVFIHGEQWSAEGEEEIGAGEKVQVVGVDGLRLRVRRAAQETARS
ncbi:MAG TPA: nodulation protein NfeD [Candidatus Binatia bacterium]|nr:nodulation protein NfeD [Candidatus Binatia bacterium]